MTRAECLEARGESTDEEKVIDVVGGGEVGVRSGAESEVFTYVDALRRPELIVTSDSETVLDRSGIPTGKHRLHDNLWLILCKYTLATTCSMQLV